MPTIQPASPLPIISGNGTVIDGASQRTANGGPESKTPAIVINGAMAGPHSYGLHLEAAHCVIRGLVINGFSGSGIEIFGPRTRSNAVQDCYIGTDAAGTSAVPNHSHGIDIALGAQENLIGGPGAGNVVSGNAERGVKLFGEGTSRNTVQGNYIGINAAGTASLANGKNGVDLDGRASDNLIGGTRSGARNVISGNGERGVLISGPGTNQNLIEGNYIGTNAAGTAAVPNHSHGVDIGGTAQDNTIGGVEPGARNVISGNIQVGVKIYGVDTRYDVVEGNYIGTDASGVRPLGNGDNGVDLAGGAQENVIGGTAPGSANRIAFNRADGMRVYDAGTKNNRLGGNDIYANAKLNVEWVDGTDQSNSHDGNHFDGPFLSVPTRKRGAARPVRPPGPQ